MHTLSQIAFIAGGIETLDLAVQLGDGEVGVTLEGGNRPVPVCDGTADGFLYISLVLAEMRV